MIRVRFFALVRELVECSQLEIAADFAATAANTAATTTAGALRAALAARGDKWQLALGERQVLIAVNQVMQDEHCLLQDGDEVAFFPPVTGG